MNKTLLAVAVSAAIAAPVANAEITVYGRINNAIDLNDLEDGGDSSTDLSTVGSRFGLRGSTDLGNGLTVHGRYEFGTVSDRESTSDDAHSPTDVRIATAGVSGSFGRIDVGNQWSAYNKTFGTLVSPTYSLGYYLYSSVGGGAFRASNTIQYSNDFGPVHAVLDVRLNEDGGEDGTQAEKLRGEGWGLGLVYNITDNLKIAGAYDVEDRNVAGVTGGTTVAQTIADDGILATGVNFGQVSADETRLGISGSWSFGNFWVNAGWQSYEIDQSTATITVADDTLDLNDDGDVLDTVNGVDETTLTGSITLAGPEDVDTYFVYVGGAMGPKTSWLLGYSEGDDGRQSGVAYGVGGTTEDPLLVFDTVTATDDSSQLTWGIYHNVGGGLRLYYEATSVEIERAEKPFDGERHLLGIRVDF